MTDDKQAALKRTQDALKAVGNDPKLKPLPRDRTSPITSIAPDTKLPPLPRNPKRGPGQEF